MIKSGVLSAYRDKGNKYLIDKSEFYRVFPDLMPRTVAITCELSREQDENQLLFLGDYGQSLYFVLQYPYPAVVNLFLF